MEPNYVMKKSAVPAMNIWLILLFWLIIPLIILIVKVVIAKSYSAEVYKDRVVIKTGVLRKKERQIAVEETIRGVTVDQTLLGRIFNYGSVKIDSRLRWDLDTQNVKDPHEFKRHLESRISRDIITKEQLYQELKKNMNARGTMGGFYQDDENNSRGRKYF